MDIAGIVKTIAALAAVCALALFQGKLWMRVLKNLGAGDKDND